MQTDPDDAAVQKAAEADPGGPGGVDRVVAVGSSAGGLAALSALLTGLPADLPVAYLIAQHMAPDHESQLVPLLSRTTQLTVRGATDAASLEPGVVLVCPPNANLRVGKESVAVVAPESATGPKPSIDLLMRSVAESWGERSVGIMLSGTGSDGSAGLRMIRDRGGLTIVQDPSSAEFDAMPRAGIATGAADLVLRPEAMGPAIAGTAAGLSPAPSATRPALIVADRTDLVGRILSALYSVTGLNFTEYRRGTVERRIARRQLVVGVPNPADYLALVATGGYEADALAKSLLVTVTSFFRDPDSWEALGAVLKDEWAGQRRQQWRVWVPGCATGEEAYTVAMVAADVLGLDGELPDRVKIFATDLSESALDIARRGHYSDDAASAIPPELRERWLRRGSSDWEVLPGLRESVIFARHNVALDPPFPHIDLISLRNTLIYLNEALHDRVLAYCHFALSPGGLLFLGDSERPSRPPGLFEPVDDQHRIYRRSATGAAAALTFPPPEPEPAPTRRTSSLAPLSDQRTVLRDAIVDRFIPPSLVVDGNDDVIEVNGDVSPWCWVAPGQPSTQALALVREELRPAIRSLLIQIRHGGPDPGMRGVASPDGETRLEARRLGPVESRWVLLSFSSVPTTEQRPTSVALPESHDDFEEPELLQVRQELGYTRLALQSTISDVSAANEELRAMNEELQASAEELQASSEEVQAANEELQATNEELTTLNQELRVRSADLTEVNTRMEQIQGSLASGMVVVDRQLRVVSFTPLAVRLFAMIDKDLGRPLTEIGTTIAVPNLERHLHASLDQKANAMLVLSDRSHHFLVQFQPYLQESQVAGVIVVVTEVTEVIQARDSATPATELTTIVDSLREVVWRSDSDGRLLFINASVEQVYGLRRDDVLSDPGLLAAAVHPDDRARVASAPIQGGHRVQDYRIVRADGAVRLVRESAFTLASEGDLSGSTIVTVLDITGT